MAGPFLFLTPDWGEIDLVTTANPAAGADVTETVPAAEMWRIDAITVLFTCGAAAANRQVFAQLETAGGAIIWRAVSTAVAVANDTAQITFGMVVATVQIGVSPNLQTNVGLPDTFALPTNVVRVSAVNRQAADDFGAAIITRQRWRV